VSFRAEGEKSDGAVRACFADFSLRSATFEMTEFGFWGILLEILQLAFSCYMFMSEGAK
jgi:hypothetical protein